MKIKRRRGKSPGLLIEKLFESPANNKIAAAPATIETQAIKTSSSGNLCVADGSTTQREVCVRVMYTVTHIDWWPSPRHVIPSLLFVRTLLTWLPLPIVILCIGYSWQLERVKSLTSSSALDINTLDYFRALTFSWVFISFSCLN